MTRTRPTAKPIPGAGSKTYRLTDEDVGSKLCPTATGSNDDGSTTTDCVFKTNIVLAPDPVQTVPTTMTGKAYTGHTLVSGVGAWVYRRYEFHAPVGEL